VATSPRADAFLIEGGDIVLPDRVIRSGALLAAEGRILASGSADQVRAAAPAGCRSISADGALVCPALWETHIHGCAGEGTDAASPRAIEKMASFLASQGVGAFLPTVVADDGMLASLGAAVEKVRKAPGMSDRIPGIYVEGPFVAPARRGGIPERCTSPVSIEAFDRLVGLAGKQIRLMTIAPELPGVYELLGRMGAAGILPSLGHSDAPWDVLPRYEGTVPLGVTHLFNCMSGVSHKQPGLAQWALLNREVFTELNCDGSHVHQAAISLALRMRPWEKIVLISDAIAPAGLSPGDPAAEKLSLYGVPIHARADGVYYRDSGTLVGSRRLVSDGVARLVFDAKVPVARAVAMASLNPARFLGYPRKGVLLPGYDADIAVFSRDFSSCSLLAWEGGILFQDGDPMPCWLAGTPPAQ
jgi:N-acetylglucosamine-6-phosphate deacetylase